MEGGREAERGREGGKDDSRMGMGMGGETSKHEEGNSELMCVHGSRAFAGQTKKVKLAFPVPR